MNMQSYYNTPLEKDADICDMSKPLCVNCAGVVDTDTGFFTRSVRRDYYLIYFLNGEMKIKLNGGQHSIFKGQFLIIEPGTKYSYFCPSGTEVHYLWLHFTGRNSKKFLEKLGILKNTINTIGIAPEVNECWQRICREFIINDKCFDIMSESILKELLSEISRRLYNTESAARFTKSIEFIHRNYNTPIKISQLAEKENLSEPHYRACFKRITGVSPGEYIADRRINSAMVLLENTDKKLSEIARLTGYKDAYYFGRAFKKKTGTSPGAYRRQSVYGKRQS